VRSWLLCSKHLMTAWHNCHYLGSAFIDNDIGSSWPTARDYASTRCMLLNLDLVILLSGSDCIQALSLDLEQLVKSVSVQTHSLSLHTVSTPIAVYASPAPAQCFQPLRAIRRSRLKCSSPDPDTQPCAIYKSMTRMHMWSLMKSLRKESKSTTSQSSCAGHLESEWTNVQTVEVWPCLSRDLNLHPVIRL